MRNPSCDRQRRHWPRRIPLNGSPFCAQHEPPPKSTGAPSACCRAKGEWCDECDEARNHWCACLLPAGGMTEAHHHRGKNAQICLSLYPDRRALRRSRCRGHRLFRACRVMPRRSPPRRLRIAGGGPVGAIAADVAMATARAGIHEMRGNCRRARNGGGIRRTAKAAQGAPNLVTPLTS